MTSLYELTEQLEWLQARLDNDPDLTDDLVQEIESLLRSLVEYD